MPAGQPPKEFKPEYCQYLFDHLSQDKSVESFAGRLTQLTGIWHSRALIFRWFNEYPEFLDAKEAGLSVGLLVAEDLLHQGIKGKIEGYNHNAHRLWLQNRYGYSDRSQVDQTTVGITQVTTTTLSLEEQLDAFDKIRKAKQEGKL